MLRIIQVFGFLDKQTEFDGAYVHVELQIRHCHATAMKRI